ncbi:MAG TPA: MarR family winged helix-turn-helix transcriptional regulator [Jatrophihabitans sp.]|nr:MarR family winged helix-turn-helix transcriptional regulator [Jatrophihabitans sp.]
MTQTSKPRAAKTPQQPNPGDPLTAAIDVLEREFRTFTINLTRFKHQVNGNRIDKLALTVLGTLTYCGPSRLTTIADRCGFDPSTVSRQVADLERAGLLEREVDPEDRRAILLKASERGRQLLRRLELGRRKRLERLLTDWTPEEIATFGRLFGRLNEATEKYGAQNTLELEQELNHG